MNELHAFARVIVSLCEYLDRDRAHVRTTRVLIAARKLLAEVELMLEVIS